MFHEYVQPILQYLHEHPYMGQLIAFLAAFSESLPIIGTIIPGSVTMTAIGTLIGAGILPGLTTLIVASIGAFLGDCIGFWVGKRYKENVKKIWPFTRYPKWLKVSEDFVKKYGIKSVVFGRFVGPARSTLPLIVGLLKLPWGKFLMAAIPSAILWAILYLTPGILLGAAALELPPEKATEFILIGLVIIVFLWFIFWAIQRFFRTLARIINRRVDLTWNWLSKHHSSRFIIRWITNQQRPQDHHQLTLFLLSILFFILFLILFINVCVKTAILGFNAPFFHFLQSIRTHSGDIIAILITAFGKPPVLITSSLLITLILFFTKNRRTASHFLLLIFSTIILVKIFKITCYSPRPTGFMVYDTSSSFPSGHTAFALAVYGYLAFLTAQLFEKKWHWVFYLLATIIVISIAYSRLYLGMHWYTDILGSVTLCMGILLAVILSYRRFPTLTSRFHFKFRYWISVIVISLLFPWSIYVGTQFSKLQYEHTPYSLKFFVAINQWWNNPHEYLPAYRNNRFGTPYQPFNIQWAGQIADIQKTLLNSHWKFFYEGKKLQYTMERFSKYQPEYHMPLFPLQYLNKPPRLIMIKHIKDRNMILELRLWHTNVEFIDTNIPLWIGTINYHLPPHKLLSIHKRSHAIVFSSPEIINQLEKNLVNYDFKIFTISKTLQPEKIKALNWDGEILIIKPKRLSDSTKGRRSYH